MNLKQLPYFIAIAETGSLSAAARRTGVSQPAVSGYLHDLERELGIALFLRSGRRMTPTAAGNIYLEMAREVLGLQARTRTQIQARHNPLKQRIRVGVSPTGAPRHWLRSTGPLISVFPTPKSCLWKAMSARHTRC